MVREERSCRNDTIQAGYKRLAKNSKRSASTLDAKREELAHFFAESLDLLCVVDVCGRFKRLSPSWTKRLGWCVEQLEATAILDFVHPEDREAAKARLDGLAPGAVADLFECRFRHRDGSYRWLRWNAQSSLAKRNRIYATVRDVTRQKELECEILDIADKERQRIGRELHDGLCQSMTGIAALSLALSRRLAEASSPEESAAAKEIAELLNGTISHARDLARDLGSIGMNGIGLPLALEMLAKDIERRFCVTCTLECDERLPAISEEQESQLFRIVQEALNNAISHGHADKIDISLHYSRARSLLKIADDGVGIPDPPYESRGIGLQTMAYRAGLIGGTLDIRRRNRGGTAVTCAFALNPKRDTEETASRDCNDS